MQVPPHWTDEQLEGDRLDAIHLFREERIREPLEDYIGQFDHFAGATDRFLTETHELLSLADRAGRLLGDTDSLFIFRYLAGPPISEDDLKALADVNSVSGRHLREHPEDVARLVATISAVLDPRRFPWFSESRQPAERERRVSVAATACLIAAQRVATKRRNKGKADQEESVRQYLLDSGLREVVPRHVRVLTQGPAPGEFCGESKLGTRKADFLVRLYDDRLMPIECKVSNSFLNSIKRLNNDAAAKAEAWRRDFGATQVIPTAVLSGLYKLTNLREAQARGLTLFWGHSLDKLVSWVMSTRSTDLTRSP